MFPQTDRSWWDYRALHQNWSYHPTLAGRAIENENKMKLVHRLLRIINTID